MSPSVIDQDTFTAAAERHRGELTVHCYRMLGSLQDAEDAVQDALLRAWRARDTFAGRSTLRAWLYRIATNCCLDALERRTRRVMPTALAPAADPFAELAPPAEIPWLGPIPDRLLDQIVDDEAGPSERIVADETIELVFLATIQHLPPRQRAVLILRDVLGWSAHETAGAVGMSTVAANSALQRARATLRQQLPERRSEWPRNAGAEDEERRLLDRYMGAWHRIDVDGIVALLKEDARMVMPPFSAWFLGREAIGAFLARVPLAPDFGRHIHVPTRANRQPAFAVFREGVDGAPPAPLGIEVLRIEDGLIAEMDVFLDSGLVAAFGISAPT